MEAACNLSSNYLWWQSAKLPYGAMYTLHSIRTLARQERPIIVVTSEFRSLSWDAALQRCFSVWKLVW